MRHEKAAQVTDSDINAALERGELDTADLAQQEIEHDEGAQPDSGRNDAPQPPTKESQGD
jgi:hypothetical protein